MNDFKEWPMQHFKERKKKMGSEKEYMKPALDMQMDVATTEEEKQGAKERRNEKAAGGGLG